MGLFCKLDIEEYDHGNWESLYLLGICIFGRIKDLGALFVFLSALFCIGE